MSAPKRLMACSMCGATGTYCYCFNLRDEIELARAEVAAWPEEWQRESAKTYVLATPQAREGVAHDH